VDRWDRRAIMLAADGGMAGSTLGLAILAMMGVFDLGPVYGAMFLRSLLEIFHWSALQASIPLLVPERHLARIAGFHQALQGTLNMIAPPAGAILLGLLPLPGVLMVDVLIAALAVSLLLFIAIPQPSRDPSSRSAWWQEMLEGLDYVRRWSGALALMGMGALINFAVNPAFALLPLNCHAPFPGWSAGAGVAGVGLGDRRDQRRFHPWCVSGAVSTRRWPA